MGAVEYGGTRSVSQEIERTGLFHTAPSVRGRTSLRGDPIQSLVEATTADQVLRAAIAYFSRIFREVVALGIHKGQAMTLMVGNERGLRTLPERAEVSLADGTLVRSVLDRPQVAYRRTADAALGSLCRSVGIPANHLTLVPAFDYGRPAFIIVGQGLEEDQLKDRFGQIKIFVEKVSKALRIVALRTEIVRDRADPGLGPRVELYAQAQVRGRSEVRIMAVRSVTTGEIFLEGTPLQYPELKLGTEIELVLFGFEDGVDDDPKFNIECRARVLRIGARPGTRRTAGFAMSLQPIDQPNRERLTSLVLRDLCPRVDPRA
jgi:hypothetical protein